MKNSREIIVIDAGNTSIKIGYFKNDQLLKSERCAKNNLSDTSEILKNHKNTGIIISSVLSDQDNESIFRHLKNAEILSKNNNFPFNTTYETPNSLGFDRICNAAFLSKHSTSQTSIVIDIGTCIKFDVMHNNQFIGGSISPGIDLRYKAMNDYTGKLPLLNNRKSNHLSGKNTNENLTSGVINGIQAEINGFINQYDNEYTDLTFFMTGGDAEYFDLHSKNDIFADVNLTLKGLYEIYIYNA